MRDGFVTQPSLGQAAGIEHVTDALRFVTFVNLFSIAEVWKPVKPPNPLEFL